MCAFVFHPEIVLSFTFLISASKRVKCNPYLPSFSR